MIELFIGWAVAAVVAGLALFGIRWKNRADRLKQQIEGYKWIVEFSGLDALNRVENSRIKQHISATDDVFRPPYGRRSITVRRKNVLAATSMIDFGAAVAAVLAIWVGREWVDAKRGEK